MAGRSAMAAIDRSLPSVFANDPALKWSKRPEIRDQTAQIGRAPPGRAAAAKI